MKQVALVTGAARGIGLGAALALAREGFDVALNSLFDDAELADFAREAGFEPETWHDATGAVVWCEMVPR